MIWIVKTLVRSCRIPGYRSGQSTRLSQPRLHLVWHTHRALLARQPGQRLRSRTHRSPFMNAEFVLSGTLLLLGVAGIFQGISEMNPRARWICAGLLALSPVGAIVCGIFTLESGFRALAQIEHGISKLVSGMGTSSSPSAHCANPSAPN